MKRLAKILSVVMIAMLSLVGCDNNEGPFETRLENGTRVLYSNEKPAKGWVKKTETSYETGDAVVVSEILYENGLPSGEFVLRDDQGNQILTSKCKRIKNNKFEGKIETTEDNWKYQAKGTFDLDSNFITEYGIEKDKMEIVGIPRWNLNTGEFKLFKNGSLFEEHSKKNGEYDGKYKEYFEDSNKLKIEEEYDNGNSVKFVEYYNDGSLRFEIVSDEDGTLSKEYSQNGILIEEDSYYKNNNPKIYKRYNNAGVLIKEILYCENGNLKSAKSYNDASLLIEEELYCENGNLKSHKKYSDNGNLILEHLCDENGKNKSYKEYNQDGLLIKERFFNEEGRCESYKIYNKDGLLGSGKFSYFYNYGWHAHLFEYDKNGSLIDEQWFDYDIDGKLISEN